MEEKKDKRKISKPRIILFALAIICVILGCIDLKVNAAEGETYYLNYGYTVHIYESDGTTYLDGYPKATNSISITADGPISIYYYQTFNEVSTGSYDLFAYVISPGQMYYNGNVWEWGTVDINGVTYHWSVAGQMTTTYLNPTRNEVVTDGASNVYVLNDYTYVPSATGRAKFLADLQNGTLDCEQIIDYNSFEIDNDMPIVSDVLRNEVVNNMKDSTLEVIVPDTYRYDYITWKNNSELELQIEICPILQYYKGVIEKDYVKEYQGEWLKTDILFPNTNHYLWLTKITSVEENYPKFTEWFYSTRDKYYPDWNEILNYTYGYRIRYVDSANYKAGAWVYVVPDKKYETYKTYIEYDDNSLSNSISANGSQGVYENLENIEDALVDVDKENQFKEGYEIVDNEVDVQEATNWLNTVTNFIKGTPQVVGSVLGFLPQPILYGMYVCIFLGVIASGIAIVKALI